MNFLRVTLFSLLVFCNSALFSVTNTPPPSGRTTLRALDAYLQSLSTAPKITILKGWYGLKDNPHNLIDIVPKLQPYADNGQLAIPIKMNEFFRGDPIPNAVKKLKLKFTLNQILYKVLIDEYNSYVPKSKYLYKIPEGTTAP